MPMVVLGLVLASAVIHAGWNLLLGRAPDSETATAVALLAGVVLFAPVALVAGTLSGSAWPYLVASAVFEAGYFALLARGYNTGRTTVIYPIARGSAPVLVLLFAVAMGDAVSPGQVAAIALIAAGVVLLRFTPGMGHRGLLLGLLTATCIAGYTLVDKRGLAHADPLPYLELAMVVPALLYVGLVLYRKGAAAVRRALSPATVACGVGIFLAYALALSALSRGAAPTVAAVRETGIVFLTAMSAVILREPIGPRQWIGALTVASGVVVIALA